MGILRCRSKELMAVLLDHDSLGLGLAALLPCFDSYGVMSMPTGTVKWYDAARGFGFLTRDDGRAVLVLSSALPADSPELVTGQRVEFGLKEGPNGAEATQVRTLESSSNAGERTRLSDSATGQRTLLPDEEVQPAAMPSCGIFLSYRRVDAAPYARLLQMELRERIPDARVFMDLDSIEAGMDFAEVIEEAIDSCAVLVVLIGRQWATLVDEDGRRRLDNADDYVRFEIQTALERGVRVIPVMVDDARPLRSQQLPSELQKLARLNAFELSYDRYQYDANRLIDILQRVIDAAPGTRAHPS
jgi:cold shock CspA family protein